MEHLKKDHPNDKPMVYNIKGDTNENLKKIISKSSTFNFLQTHWELIDEKNNGGDKNKSNNNEGGNKKLKTEDTNNL